MNGRDKGEWIVRELLRNEHDNGYDVYNWSVAEVIEYLYVYCDAVQDMQREYLEGLLVKIRGEKDEKKIQR